MWVRRKQDGCEKKTWWLRNKDGTEKNKFAVKKRAAREKKWILRKTEKKLFKIRELENSFDYFKFGAFVLKNKLYKN